MVSINIKWSGQEMPLDIDSSKQCTDLMEMIEQMTGVPKERMKVIGVKNVSLQNEQSLEELGFKDGQKLMVIGNKASKVLVEPKVKTKFVEDLTDKERIELFNETGNEPLPIGIQNSGVTCYLNSVVQAMRAVTPLKEAMIKKASDGQSDNSLVSLLAQLFYDLDAKDVAPNPVALITMFRAKYPQLARRSSSGMGFMQQDTEEFLQCIFDTVKQSGISLELDGEKTTLQDLFSFYVKTTMAPLDSSITIPEGSSSAAVDDSLMKLSCVMGQALEPTSLMHVGIERGLVTEIEKRVEGLGDDNIKFLQTSRMDSLPKFLNVHFIRFEWKKSGESGTRAKITRKVAFSSLCDVFQFCTPELQEKLRPTRLIKSEIEDIKEDDAECKYYPDGNFELISIVTHQGRTADSGHYLGWRRKYLQADAKDTSSWLQFDDDKVKDVKFEGNNILDLQGGRSDYHIAYMTFWRQRTFKIPVAKYNETREKQRQKDIELEALMKEKEEREKQSKEEETVATTETQEE